MFPMSDSSVRQSSSRVVFLDWLRVIAFLSVLAGHKYAAAYNAVIQDPGTQPTLRFLMQLFVPMIEFGGAGVVVFFLVSGYIITHVLQREDGRAFLIRRFFRIYPLFWCAVLFETTLAAWSGQPFRGWGVLLGQMSLFGDAFQVPHALAGVEWTLRVEVLFYLFMAALKVGGVIDGRWKAALPAVLVLGIVGLFLMPRVPGKWAWCYAYLNLYGPFLLLGALYYLVQSGRASASLATGASLAVLLGYWILLPQLQPPPSQSHFAFYGLIVFLVLWLRRDKLSIGPFGLLLSELTYPVYLFHNWLYEPIQRAVTRVLPTWSLIATLLGLLAFCWVTVRLVERPAIRIGQRLSARSRQPVPVSEMGAGSST